MAQLYCGVGLHGEGDALLVGPLGNVTNPSKWWNPVHATIRYVNGRTVELDGPFESAGFNYEVVTSAISYAVTAQRAQFSHTTCRAR
jgi:scyllo-inositol 2-dehydrogenase (NADP+)